MDFYVYSFQIRADRRWTKKPFAEYDIFLYRCCGIFNMKLLFGAIDFIYLNVEKDKMMHREQLTINLIHRLTPPSIENYHILNIHIVL